MIGTAIIFIVWAFATAISSPLRLLSDATLPANVTASITSMGGYLTSVSNIVPVATILTILSAVLVIEGSVFLYKVFMWILRRIPTQS